MQHIRKSVVRIPAKQAGKSGFRTLGFNASMLDDHPTGVGIFTHNLANHLGRISNNSERYALKVFTPTLSNLESTLDTRMLSSLMCSSKYGKIAAGARLLWNLLVYPFSGKGMDLLINPTTHGSLSSRPQILTIHDLLSMRFDNISSHQKLYFSLLLPFMIRKAAAIVAVSESTKRDIIEAFKCPEDKIRVIHNGYDHRTFKYLGGQSTRIVTELGISNYFLAVGPTYPHKNFSTLLRSYAQLPEKIKEVNHLVIVGGKEPYVTQVQQEANMLQIEPYVRFLGYAPASIMPALYNEALCLVFPSLHEGFGIPLLEAMACGCPVISSGASSMPEVCGDAALYFNPSSDATLSILMKKMAEKQIDREILTQKGLKRASYFSWEKTAEEYLKLAEEILNRKRF